MSLDDVLKKVKGESVTPKTAVLMNFRNKKVKLTMGDLREAVKANPDHPCAWPYQKACGDLKGQTPLPDGREATVDQVDILCLIENKEVKEKTGTDEQGNPFKEKYVGPAIKKSAKAPAPTSTPTEKK